MSDNPVTRVKIFHGSLEDSKKAVEEDYDQSQVRAFTAWKDDPSVKTTMSFRVEFCSRTLLGAKQPWPARPSPTRPQEVLGFEQLLSELIARALMLRPHLGSRLVSAPLTFGVHCRTLSGEERCGGMIANPVKSTCTSTTPQLSERAGADACL